MEQLDRVRLGAAFHGFHRTVNDAFGNRLLTVEHEVVHELGNNEITELRVRIDDALLCAVAT